MTLVSQCDVWYAGIKDFQEEFYGVWFDIILNYLGRKTDMVSMTKITLLKMERNNTQTSIKLKKTIRTIRNLKDIEHKLRNETQAAWV